MIRARLKVQRCFSTRCTLLVRSQSLVFWSHPRPPSVPRRSLYPSITKEARQESARDARHRRAERKAQTEISFVHSAGCSLQIRLHCPTAICDAAELLGRTPIVVIRLIGVYSVWDEVTVRAFASIHSVSLFSNRTSTLDRSNFQTADRGSGNFGFADVAGVGQIALSSELGFYVLGESVSEVATSSLALTTCKERKRLTPEVLCKLHNSQACDCIGPHTFRDALTDDNTFMFGVRGGAPGSLSLFEYMMTFTCTHMQKCVQVHCHASTCTYTIGDEPPLRAAQARRNPNKYASTYVHSYLSDA